MQTTTKTAKEIYNDVKNNPARKRFGFGNKAVLVNIDPQKSYTRTDLFKTAYETDPRQMEYINTLAKKFRAIGWPVVWTHVAYMESGEDAGIWGTRTDTPDSLQNIKFGSERSEFDDRLEIDRVKDVIYLKKMPQGYRVGCHVFVYPLLVREQHLDWPERDQREFHGVSIADAAVPVSDRGLMRALRNLSKKDNYTTL